MSAKLNYEFIAKNANLNWTDLVYGVDNGYIDWVSLKEFAMDQVCNGSGCELEVELAGLSNNDNGAVIELATKISEEHAERNVRFDSKSVWLYLVPYDLFLRKDERPDALADVEMIYADFDYPEEIEGFVRYMPPIDGIESLGNSYQENIRSLYEKWHDYLEEKKVLYSR